MSDVLRLKEGVVKLVLTTGTGEGHSLLDLINNIEFQQDLVKLFHKFNIYVSDVDFQGVEDPVYTEFTPTNPLLN